MSDQSIVEVSQADRDAAGELYRRYLGEGSAVEAAILDGEYDHDERVQILARHRIAEREACAMVAEDCVADIPHCQPAASLIAAAIRARS